MAPYRLIVSDPPQDGVRLEEAARHLDLTPEQFEGKIAYPVPEIWFAHPDPVRVQETAVALHEAHCSVRVVSGDELIRFPARRRVRAFSFDQAGFVAHADDGDVTVPYEVPMVAVFCRPREVSAERVSGGRVRRSSAIFSYRDRVLESSSGATQAIDELDDTPFLDLFVGGGNGGAQRLTIMQSAVSFAGLGRLQPRAASNMDMLVSTCEDRFGHDHVDRRLVGMRLRARGSIRPPGSEHRRGFSFASPGLMALLSAVSGDMAHISQPELASRLACLTRRAGH